MMTKLHFDSPYYRASHMFQPCTAILRNIPDMFKKCPEPSVDVPIII